MNRRPTPTDIFDWIEGRLSAERAQVVADHVATDPEAADTAAWFRQFLADAGRLPLEKPPADLSQRLRDLFREGAHVRDPRWSTARMLYDTREAMVAGMRSADTLDTVHLAFESDAGRFVLEVRPSAAGSTVDLIGLLLLETAVEAVDLSLLEAGVVRRMVRVGPDGRFELTDVPETVDELRFVAGGAQVSAPLHLERT